MFFIFDLPQSLATPRGSDFALVVLPGMLCFVRHLLERGLGVFRKRVAGILLQKLFERRFGIVIIAEVLAIDLADAQESFKSIFATRIFASKELILADGRP